MSDTPRTDAEANEQYSMGLAASRLRHALVQSDFARQLERELTEARTRIKELADIGGALADCVGCGCSEGGCKVCRRSLNDWEETVKRCLEGIE